ncbi:SH3 domain-containing protein [Streptomyces xanthochromogenes]|uniref:SH3 domain-containing protein n=1 Tax=Streptomyces xanthochromogenes TaxID=67384 RepID=UPI0034484518
MHTGRTRRALAAGLLACGLSAGGVAMAVTATAAPAHHDDGPVWGTVTSRIELNVREDPTLRADVVTSLSPGDQDRVECKTRGTDVNGTSWWYWLGHARGWVSASYVDAQGRVPDC